MTTPDPRTSRGGKSPWNPSKTATARVLDPLPTPEACPHCDGPVVIAHHDDVFGSAYSDWPWLYRCAPCDAHVGMHPFTAIPLGTLANRDLRILRKRAKDLFNPRWTFVGGPVSVRSKARHLWRQQAAGTQRAQRTEAYAWLAQQLGIHVSECHFGWFDEDTCIAVINILEGA